MLASGSRAASPRAGGSIDHQEHMLNRPQPDLVLLHPPVSYRDDVRYRVYGPVAESVPTSPLFEMYPIGFVSIADYLGRNGFDVRIINTATKLLSQRRFSLNRLLRPLRPLAFGIDFHWLVHLNGCRELALAIRECCPEVPIIIGGYSASYYHRELFDFLPVDYVVRGDSAEAPLLELLGCLSRRVPPRGVANVTWRDHRGQLIENPLSHVPSTLGDTRIDYERILRDAVRFCDPVGYAPYHDFFRRPMVAAFTNRGCVHDCATCGGSRSALRLSCARGTPAFRSPEVVVRDVLSAQRYVTGPIFIGGDIRQAGPDYVRQFFEVFSRAEVRNQVILEICSPAEAEFYDRIAHAFESFSIQISPETHDEDLRRLFGRRYTNEALEETIAHALAAGCRAFKLFFMIGLPRQDRASVLGTVSYCEKLLDRFGAHKQLHPFISHLSPFVDPGSPAFEDPERFGYRLLCHSLEEHAAAMAAPTWKHMLGYETDCLTRDDLVAVTYEAMCALDRVKVEHGLLPPKVAARRERQFLREASAIADVDEALASGQEVDLPAVLRSRHLKPRLRRAGVLYDRDEVTWRSKLLRFNAGTIIWDSLVRRRR